MNYFYSDEYLKDLVTEDMSIRAEEYVNSIGVFSDEWKERLVVIRSYLIVCMESVKAEGDIFTIKHKFYSKEFETSLRSAKSDAAAAAGGRALFMSIDLSRG